MPRVPAWVERALSAQTSSRPWMNTTTALHQKVNVTAHGLTASNMVHPAPYGPVGGHSEDRNAMARSVCPA